MYVLKKILNILFFLRKKNIKFLTVNVNKFLQLIEYAALCQRSRI